MSYPPADQLLRGLSNLADELTGRIPADAVGGSPRHHEEEHLRAHSNARAELLRDLSIDVALLIGEVRLMVEGVADCFELAGQRDNAVHGAATAVTLRPALELAGQAAWLLDDAIVDPDARALNYVAWRFADLGRQRRLLSSFRSDNADATDAEVVLHEAEGELSATAIAAGYVVDPTRISKKGRPIGATVLGAAGDRIEVPSLTSLIGTVSSTASVYPLMSTTTHPGRFSLRQRLEVESTDDAGLSTGRLTGFALEPNLLVGLAVLAVDRSCRMLAGWNSVDASDLHDLALFALAACGIGP